MASTPRPSGRRPARPVVGSRNPTGRPRTVAGRYQPPAGTPVDQPVDQPSAPPPPVEEAAPPPEPPPSPADRIVEEPPEARGPGSGVRTTLVLVIAIVVLVGVAAAEGWYLWLRDEPVVSADRPVVTGEVAHRSAVEAASQAADEIVSTSYKNYDEQVDQAVSKMTDGFAAKYRQTAEDVRDQFVEAKKEVQVEVAAAGVVRADESQGQALLFLNQYVTTDGKDTAYTPYRALVTVVNTDQGWLVSDIETK
jgi:Mce-associated membrane protein